MSLASWGNFCDSSSIRSFWAMLLPSRVSLLEDPKNCPRKYLKIFTTEFIFRQQKILLTIDVIEAWQIGVEPSTTSNSFACFFSSFLCFLVSFEIQSSQCFGSKINLKVWKWIFVQLYVNVQGNNGKIGCYFFIAIGILRSCLSYNLIWDFWSTWSMFWQIKILHLEYLYFYNVFFCKSLLK